MQKGIFAVLVLIAFLLGANLFSGNEVQAAKVYKYELVSSSGGINDKEIQDTLNKASQQGYEYVGTYSGSHALIFRK